MFDDFQPSWELLDLVTHIEKFGVYWQSVNENELIALEALTNSGSQRQRPLEIIFSAAIVSTSDDRELILDRYQQLMFWFETNLTIPPLVRCSLFAYAMADALQPSKSKNESVNKFAESLLLDLGYNWVGWISPDQVCTFENKSISLWSISFLSRLRDGQQKIMQRFDRNGLAKVLTLSDRLLLHIIEYHPEITTKYIARKLGRSEVTVRRMLSRLRKMQIIRAHSSGPKRHHCLALKINNLSIRS